MLTDPSMRPLRALPETAEVHSAAFLESVLDASQDCIKVLTLDGAIVFMNSSGQTMMEIDDFESARGRSWPLFWAGEEAVASDALARAKVGLTGHFTGAANTMKGTPKWWDVTVTPIVDDDGAPTHILAISRDITVARELQLQRELLGAELVHRVKNVLAVVGAIAGQSFRGGDPDQLDTFRARLVALGDAQSLLIEGAVVSASIRDVVTRSIMPHCPHDRCTVTGPAHHLDAKRSLALSLAIHELATNAVKYGALANDSGAVRVEWHVEAGELDWTWTESGGPVVQPPLHAGFGSRIITRNLESEFRGRVNLQHLPAGVVLTLTAPA